MAKNDVFTKMVETINKDNGLNIDDDSGWLNLRKLNLFSSFETIQVEIYWNKLTGCSRW